MRLSDNKTLFRIHEERRTTYLPKDQKPNKFYQFTDAMPVRGWEDVIADLIDGKCSLDFVVKAV